VAGRTLSGAFPSAHLAAPPSFPRPLLAATGVTPAATTRAEKFEVLAHLLLSLGATALELARLPKLKFFAQADKSDLGRDARVGAKAFRKHDTSVLVDREDLGDTVKRDRKLVPLDRIVRQAREKPVDRARKSLAACIDRSTIERGVAVDVSGPTLLGNRRVREWREKAQGRRRDPLPSILLMYVETKRSIPSVEVPSFLLNATTATENPLHILNSRTSPLATSRAPTVAAPSPPPSGLAGERAVARFKPSVEPAPRPTSPARCGRAFMGCHGF
jgi:hypothetical protein